jgi:hypothetical protein
MPKFNVSCDLRVPVLLEIEAISEYDAYSKLFDISIAELMKSANTTNDSIEIDQVSIRIEPGVKE